MERWTFLMIAGPDGAAEQVRVFFRSGDDQELWPSAQMTLDGTEMPVDDAAHDYEAPEWKVVQELDAAMGGLGGERLETLKAELRARSVA